MYHRHSPLPLVLGFLLCALLFLLGTVLQRRRSRLFPRNGVFAIGVVAGFLLLLAAGVRSCDNGKLRSELRSVVPAEVPRLVIAWGGRKVETTSKTEISTFLSEVQRLTKIGAHHSYPTEPFDLTIDVPGRQLRYRFGRDSQNRNEYWVFRLDSSGEQDLEIGRLRSDTLGSLVDALLKNQP